MSLAALALIDFLLSALATDLRQQPMFNTLIVFAPAAGVLLNLIGPQDDIRSAGLFTHVLGALGLKGALFLKRRSTMFLHEALVLMAIAVFAMWRIIKIRA